MKNFICLLFLFSNQIIFSIEPWQLTSKAWNAMGQKDWDKVADLANQANRTWGNHARAKNQKITKLPGKDLAKKYATLNELATITYLKGLMLHP